MRSAKDWMCLSSTASLDSLIRSSKALLLKGRPDNLDCLQNRENLSSTIFVDRANLRAAIAGLQSGWSNGTTKSLGALQGAPWQLLCTFVPRRLFQRPFQGLKRHRLEIDSEKLRQSKKHLQCTTENGSWARKSGSWAIFGSAARSGPASILHREWREF